MHCAICQILSLMFFFQTLGPTSTCTPRAPDTAFAEFQRLWRGPRPSFAAFLPQVRGPRFLHFFFAELFQSSPEPAFVAVFNYGVVSHTFRHFECLSFTFGTLFAAFDPGGFLFCNDQFLGIFSAYLWILSFYTGLSNFVRLLPLATISSGVSISNLWMTILWAFGSWHASTHAHFSFYSIPASSLAWKTRTKEAPCAWHLRQRV